MEYTNGLYSSAGFYIESFPERIVRLAVTRKNEASKQVNLQICDMDGLIKLQTELTYDNEPLSTYCHYDHATDSVHALVTHQYFSKNYGPYDNIKTIHRSKQEAMRMIGI
ncbi:MAG: hypothetical protein Q4A55_00010 [Aerococcus sp.]|nr:hypothetical protein [Aerococcus sp.]